LVAPERGIAAVRKARRPLVWAPPSRYTMGLLLRKAWGAAMKALIDVIKIVLDLYVWLLIAAAVLSWLVAFNVVNVRNPVVATIGDFLYRITEPLLRPIRNMMPNLGGLDISPVILILIIILIQRLILYYVEPYVF
jgi:YggT family protein